MTTIQSQLKKEVLILMPFFGIRSFDSLLKIHGTIEAVHAHLAELFDNRKALKN